MSVHYHFMEDEQGDLVDVVPFDSDYCHREWCKAHDVEYQGWNGCQSPAGYAEYCAECGDLIHDGLES